MKKIYILYGIGILGVIYFVFKVGHIVYYSHNTEHLPQRYLYLFKDSEKINIDTVFCVGHSRKSDVYYHYIYRNDFDVMVFEYKELGSLDIRKIAFNKNINLDNFFENFSGEAYNMSLYPSPEISISFELKFNNSFAVNLDKSSKIRKRIEGKNYVGFFGEIYKMSFCNSLGKDLVLFDYKREATPTLFLFYKYQGRLLVIIINSEKKFDENIINILNLKTSDI